MSLTLPLQGTGSRTRAKPPGGGARSMLTVGPQRRQPRPTNERQMTRSLHRRQILSLVGALALAPRMSLAQDGACPRLAEGLYLCTPKGWTLLPTLEGATASLISPHGIAADITFRNGLTQDQIDGARQMILHAPLSARALVLETGLFQIGNQVGATVAYLPRHSDPALVVGLSDVIGSDFTLVVTTRETGFETYSETHKSDHAALLAALRLDKDP